MKDELRDKIIEWLSDETSLLEVECEAAGDGLISLLAPELEKAEKYDALCLIKDPIQVEREYFQELVAKAEKWDKVKECARLRNTRTCDTCPLVVCEDVLCTYAKSIVEALEGGQDDKS